MRPCIRSSKPIIKVMGDYCSSGLWSGIYGPEIEPSELNIPESLQNRIKKWIRSWRQFYFSIPYEDDWKPGTFSRRIEKIFYHSKRFRELVREQWIIARLLHKYIGDQYTIVFYDEKKLFIHNGHVEHIYKVSSERKPS